MSDRKQYKNPPIQEALCEIGFVPSRPWNFTIPGKLHSSVQSTYDGEPQQQNVIETQFEAQHGQKPNFQAREGFGKVLLPTADGTRILGIGENIISVHILKPYQRGDELNSTGWVEFRNRISEALDSYWKIANPKGVNRIGLRYINTIEVSAENAVVTDYVLSGPQNIKGLPSAMTTFASRDEYLYDDGVRLVISQGLAPPSNPNVVCLLLDLDLIWHSELPLDKDAALQYAENLRVKERDVFELLITDKSRAIFNAQY